MKQRQHDRLTAPPGRSVLHPAVLMLTASLLALLATGCAGTPPIEGADTIAVREEVDVNGKKQGIVVRGHDRNAPVLLWLAGGPGGSELGWTTTYLAELERDVVFVNWDQPGVGISWSAGNWEEATVDDFVVDTIAMSEYLRDRFRTDRIILAGHSWGSIIGLKAVARRPDLYDAYLAVAQQVNAVENDRHGYEMVLSAARRRGDSRVVRRLREMGPPPYGADEGGNYVYLFQKVHLYSPHPSPEPTFTSMVFPPEYTLRDSINAVRGIIHGVTRVYPQLNGLDFAQTVPAVEVPVFFFTGRYDETCVQDITWRYYRHLEAPYKEFFWFERSGHNVPYQEPERFVDLMRTRVLPRLQ